MFFRLLAFADMTRLRCLALLLALLVALLPLQGRAEEFSEAEIKAVYLYNFAFYITWPQTAVVEPDSSIQYCVFNSNSAISESLAELFTTESNTARKFELKTVVDLQGVKTCHLLFIDQHDPVKSSRVIEAVANSSVLTVSDRAGFAQKWGMIELLMENGRISPIINTERLDAAKLSASSKLLRLVKRINGKKGND